jgi:hypothetical protein
MTRATVRLDASLPPFTSLRRVASLSAGPVVALRARSLVRQCHGTWPAAGMGTVILLSYLGLFLRLYRQRFDAAGRDTKRGPQQHPDESMQLAQAQARAATHALVSPASSAIAAPARVDTYEGAVVLLAKRASVPGPLHPTTGAASPAHVVHAASAAYPSPTAALAAFDYAPHAHDQDGAHQRLTTTVQAAAAASEVQLRARVHRRHASNAGGS